jgi:hypothetical protein
LPVFIFLFFVVKENMGTLLGNTDRTERNCLPIIDRVQNSYFPLCSYCSSQRLTYCLFLKSMIFNVFVANYIDNSVTGRYVNFPNVSPIIKNG